jgi:flagellar hook assembly protein FlgD
VEEPIMFRFMSVAAVVAAAAALTLVATAGAMSHPKLIGVVGKNDAFTITLKNSHGKLVKTIKQGTYTFVISDDSAIHNFELDGPHGKSWVFTSVPFAGKKTKTLKLMPGKYKAYCVAHESQMFQHFTVK